MTMLFQHFEKELQSAPIREPRPDQPLAAAPRSSNGGTIEPCNLKAFKRDLMNTGYSADVKHDSAEIHEAKMAGTKCYNKEVSPDPSQINLKKCATKVYTAMDRNSGAELPIQSRYIVPNSKPSESKITVKPVLPKHKPSRIPIRTKKTGNDRMDYQRQSLLDPFKKSLNNSYAVTSTSAYDQNDQVEKNPGAQLTELPRALNSMKKPEDNGCKPKNILKPSAHIFSNADVNPRSSTDYGPAKKDVKKSWAPRYQEQESQEFKENSLNGFFNAKGNLPDIPKKSFKDSDSNVSKADAERRCAKTFEPLRKDNVGKLRYNKVVNKSQNRNAKKQGKVKLEPKENTIEEDANDQVVKQFQFEMPSNPDIVEPTVKPTKPETAVRASSSKACISDLNANIHKTKSSKKLKKSSKLFEFNRSESQVKKGENEEEDVKIDNPKITEPVKHKRASRPKTSGRNISELDMQPSTSKAAETKTSQPKGDQPKTAQLKEMPSKAVNKKVKKSKAKKRKNDDANKDPKSTEMHQYKIPKLSANKPHVKKQVRYQRHVLFYVLQLYEIFFRIHRLQPLPNQRGR